jgi:predicted amidophosphoribosyltransferase
MRHRLLATAAALLAPPLCVGCRGATAPAELICPRCRRLLRALPVPLARAGAPQAAFPHEGVARRLVAALKFHGAAGLAPELAALMRERLPAAALEADCIVPVPAHPLNRRRRGYNQSLLLARALAVAARIPVADCLTRAPSMPPQAGLGRAERLALPRTAYSCAAPPAGRILLVDDVVTTGSTLARCSDALQSGAGSGAASLVRSVTFATAGRPSPPRVRRRGAKA